MKLNQIPKIELTNLPTPLDEAPRLAKEIGLERLFIKRDDTTTLALGGNKARKLEYLMAEAKNSGAQVVLTCGGPQSNHARITAAAARKLGMESILFLVGEQSEEFQGNQLIEVLLGAEIRFLPNASYESLRDIMAREENNLKERGKIPYVIPIGGSTPLGSLGYVNAAKEISDQLKSVGAENADIVIAVGSGGTTAGLSLGCSIFAPQTMIYGVSVSRAADQILDRMKEIASDAAKMIGSVNEPDLGKLSVYDEYVGEAYGIPTTAGIEAILTSARTEGIILDPVYTGKAMAGLIDLAKKKIIGQGRPVVFWHTGGSAGLFACEKLFRNEAKSTAIEG